MAKKFSGRACQLPVRRSPPDDHFRLVWLSFFLGENCYDRAYHQCHGGSDHYPQAYEGCVEKKSGGSIDDTVLINGIVLDKEIVHSGMPTKVEKARIALVNAALEVEKTEMSAEIRISDPTQMQQFLEEENKMLKSMVDKIHSIGANVLVCQKGIDDIAQHYLSKHGILSVRRVKESDMTKIGRASCRERV